MLTRLPFIIFACLFSSAGLLAQNAQWALRAGSTGDQNSYDVVLDKDGNAIIVGALKGTNIDFDPSSKSSALLSSTGDNDIFVAKYNSSGQYVWAFRLGGALNDAAEEVMVDSLGNIYVSGYFRGTGIDFDPSPSGVFVLNSNGHSGNDTGFGGDAFLSKYSPSGELLWAFSMGSPSVYDGGGRVAIDEQGNVLWTGQFTGTNVDFDPSPAVNTLSAQGTIETFLAKYTSDGQFIWAKRFGGHSVVNSGGRGIAVINSGIFLTGHFDGTIDLDPGANVSNFSSSGCGDFYLVKLDTSGNHIWSFKVGGSNCDYVFDMGKDTAGHVYITGFFSSANVDFNPGAAVNALSTKGGDDIFVAKYDENGNYVMAQSFGSSGGDQSFGISVGNDGYTITGGFSGTVDFDAGSGVYNLSSAGAMDIFVSQFTLGGQHKRSFRMGAATNDVARGVTSSAGNEVYLTGYFAGANLDFDPSPNKLLLSSAGGNDVFLAKYVNLDLVNSIAGYVFLDHNRNGIKEAVEPFFKAAMIRSTRDSTDTVKTTSSNGRFSFSIDTGLYTTRVFTYLPYYTTVPAFDTTAFATYNNTDSVKFALQLIPAQRDLAIVLIPLGPSRPGFNVQYKLLYMNKGTDTVTTGSVQFIKDSMLSLLYSFPAYNQVSGDTLTWNYSDLKPGDTASVMLYMKVAAPPAVANGDTLKSVAAIHPIPGDLVPADNTSRLRQVVIGSYDPNDKNEKHGGIIQQAELTDETYLEYTIRFQNTGTDTAFNIEIRDTLSSKLNWNSFEMIIGSHDYQLSAEGNKLSFKFNNILLVDSFRNEPRSHGYIVYRIKPVAGLSAGDSIKNSAAIYFDYNLPVITNTSVTVLQSTSLPVKLVAFEARKQGKQNQLQWTTLHEDNTSHFEVQRSADGRVFSALGNVPATGGNNRGATYSFTDAMPLAAVNYYRLKMVDKDGKAAYSATRKINNELHFNVTVNPNPVSSIILLKIESELKGELDIKVVDVNGKVLLTSRVTVTSGILNKSIDASMLSRGTYFLVADAGNQKLSIPFQKM